MEAKERAEKKEVEMRSAQNVKLENALVENFILLQRAMTNVSVKLDDLSDKLARLLEVFEISAKALAEKNIDFVSENKEILQKLDDLSEQNRVIARGLTLLGERQRPAPPRNPEFSSQL